MYLVWKWLFSQEAMFLFTYAGLYLYSGSIMIKHYKDSNSDMGKAMGSMAIISGGVMGVEFINELLHIYKTRWTWFNMMGKLKFITLNQTSFNSLPHCFFIRLTS